MTPRKAMRQTKYKQRSRHTFTTTTLNDTTSGPSPYRHNGRPRCCSFACWTPHRARNGCHIGGYRTLPSFPTTKTSTNPPAHFQMKSPSMTDRFASGAWKPKLGQWYRRNPSRPRGAPHLAMAAHKYPTNTNISTPPGCATLKSS